MKHEWRKSEKAYYLPKNKPETVTVPAFKFFTIMGQGNPNSDTFPEFIQAMYTLSYAIKMSPKSGNAPDQYTEYTVYPLEGVWDISEEAKKNFNGKIDKDTLIFKLMIRQPDFVTESFALETIEKVKSKKPNVLLDDVKFEVIEEGRCIQMLHLGSYDEEPKSFEQMENFATEHGLKRVSKIHREIYLSDARKVSADKLKTVLRFQTSNLLDETNGYTHD